MKIFKNLEAELARNGLKRKDITDVIFNGATNKTWRKLTATDQTVELTLKECEQIRDTFFPDMTIDYLFARGDSSERN